MLAIVNRSVSVHSECDAAKYLDTAICTCNAGGFKRVRLRGDCKFSQTEYLDGWDELGVKFQFGFECRAILIEKAENRAETEWKRLKRTAAYERSGPPRTHPENVKRDLIRQREYEHLELQYEEVAEFNYRPGACKKDYRMVVIRKNISKEKGER